MSRAAAVVLGLVLCLSAAAPAQDATLPPDTDPPQNGESTGGTSGGISFKRAPFRTTGPQQPDLIEGIDTVQRPGAVLRRLDKMTGASETLTLNAGGIADGGRLVVALAACVSPPDNGIEGTRAFLTIEDRSGGPEPAFSGWMFADSPALSALDHPRFDVWVISCTTSEGVAVSGSE